MTTLIERGQDQRNVNEQAGVQQSRSDGVAPEAEKPEPACFQSLERDNAESVVEKVRTDVCVEDETGPEPQTSNQRESSRRQMEYLQPGWEEQCNVTTVGPRLPHVLVELVVVGRSPAGLAGG